MPVLQSRLLFLQMLQREHPELYADAMRAATTSNLSGSGLGSLWDSLTNAVNQLATTYVEGKAAVEQIKINAQRASQGLAPLTGSAQQTYAPTQPTAQQVAVASSGFSMPTWGWVLLGAGAIFLLTRVL